jgi:hypothetical protein
VRLHRTRQLRKCITILGQLFATTDSERMKKTLESAGFVQKGMSGSDHEENFRYGAKNE